MFAAQAAISRQFASAAERRCLNIFLSTSWRSGLKWMRTLAWAKAKFCNDFICRNRSIARSRRRNGRWLLCSQLLSLDLQSTHVRYLCRPQAETPLSRLCRLTERPLSQTARSRLSTSTGSRVRISGRSRLFCPQPNFRIFWENCGIGAQSVFELSGNLR